MSGEKRMRKLLENRREKWLVEHILTMKKTNVSVNEFVLYKGVS
jgi:hypothetical protein